ncbi:MAG: zinc ABC transporter substrate-binding protein [Candidatus Hydrogenedentes bacterium]|nr:zinc ABC transporter substrate-binding protein [Candidatus Hydrogenedentota bacterium]
MKNISFLMVAFLSVVGFAQAEPLRVVTTLSTYADLVKTVGGEEVVVKHIVPAKFNPHFITPRPSDVLSLKKADLFVHTGLDLELWRGPLLDAAGNVAARPGAAGDLDLSIGIPLLEIPERKLSRAEGDIHLFGNPHYWLDPHNGIIMASSIANKLSDLDPANEAKYRERFENFKKKVESKISEWKSTLAAFAGTELVGYHNQWPYFTDFTGTYIRKFIEPKPGVSPTPRHLKSLETYIEDEKISVIVYSTIFSSRPVKALSKRSGAKGVVLAHNVGELPEAVNYIAMIDFNVNQLAAALR